MKYLAQYLVFPATIHVTSRKIGYLWNSAPATTNHLCLYFSNIKLVKIYLCCTARLFSFFCQHIVKRHKTQDTRPLLFKKPRYRSDCGETATGGKSVTFRKVKLSVYSRAPYL